ncbi:MAG: hypothetical protein V3U35_07925 [Candidatus Neomarinimicrobiota bacterium]
MQNPANRTSTQQQVRIVNAIRPGLLIALTIVSCAEKEATVALPDPSIVSPSEIAEDSDRVYYIANSGPKTREDAEQILLVLLEDQIPVLNAWFPTSASICACPNCTECIVIELQMPNSKILNHNFLEDAENWTCNCAVEEMWYYSFDSQ